MITTTVGIKPNFCYHLDRGTDSGPTFSGSVVGSNGTNIYGVVTMFDPVNVPANATVTAVRLVISAINVTGSVPTINIWYNNTAAQRDGGPSPLGSPYIPPGSSWTSGFGVSDTTRGTFTIDIPTFNTWRAAFNWLLFLPDTDNEGGSYTLDFDQTDAILEVDFTLPTANPTETTVGGDTVLTFTESGIWTPPAAMNIRTLIVAGGGGGGGKAGRGGGGGAGGMKAEASHAVTVQEYAVIVGAGGSGSDSNAGECLKGHDGGNSSIDSTESTGGGGGGTGPNGTYADGTDARDGRPGGSGGGAGDYAGSGSVGSGTVGQGNNGGLGLEAADAYGGGGGGGAGAVGGAGSSTNGGNGGNGSANDITGASVTYAGGGGGGCNNGTVGAGGTGGGGAGGKAGGTAATAGTDGLGGGGGGGMDTQKGADGGDGVVIVRFETPAPGGGGEAGMRGLLGIGV